VVPAGRGIEKRKGKGGGLQASGCGGKSSRGMKAKQKNRHIPIHRHDRQWRESGGRSFLKGGDKNTGEKLESVDVTAGHDARGVNKL